jgi:hypothetical protein
MVAGPGSDLREMVVRLEQQELDCQAASGTVPTSLYTELLAAYLAEGELTKYSSLTPCLSAQSGQVMATKIQC